MSDNKQLREITNPAPGTTQAPLTVHVPDAGHSQPDVERFLDSMWSERGLSENTLAAYRADLSGLSRWLEGQSVELMDAQREHLLAFLAWRVQQGARPRSTARQLSSIRRFY